MILYDFNGNEINIENNQVTVKQNNDEIIDDFLNVANSYLNRDDIVYRDGETVIWQSTPTNGMDCSTFVSLCLMGYDYFSSPYYTHQYKSTSQWIANTLYNWALSTVQYKISRFIDGHNPDENMRLACQIGKWMIERGQSVPLTNGFRDVQKGDIVFWARRNRTTGEYIRPTWYKHITHIGIIYNIEDAPNIYNYTDTLGIVHNVPWDKNRFPFKHTIIECTDTTPCVITSRFLEIGQDTPTNYYESNCNTIAMICRPDFGALRRITE